MFIGIRRENKNIWEKRAPITPDDVEYLLDNHDIKTTVQPSHIRIYSESEYENSGALINEDLENAKVILGIKEIHQHLIQKDKTYLFFSHTIKGQPYNMEMLRTLMNSSCNLIDYERIVDDNNKRLIFFGPFAGMAGMIETLHCLGIKLSLNNIHNPFEDIKQAYEYHDVDDAINQIKIIANKIFENGIPDELIPLIFGFTGYGNVSKGAQKIFDLFPHIEISPEDLLAKNYDVNQLKNKFVKVVFKEKDTVKPKSGKFELQDYFSFPEKYESDFDRFIPYLDVLINCILWTNKNPRLITKKYLKENDYRLKVIGDISCDIDGGIEITYKPTSPDEPTFTYFPQYDRYIDATEKEGITVMSIDNLPCEFPRDSSKDFSRVLREFIHPILTVDFDLPFDELNLPLPIKRAMILHKGKLTKNYMYLNQFIEKL